MSEEAVPDVGAIVAELQAEVERRRAAGAYPPSLLAKLDIEFRPDEGGEPPEASLLIDSARSLHSTWPVLGGAIVFGKKVVRRLLAWYVAPIAADQTRFNVAILRELRAVERRLARVETPWTRAAGEPDADTWARLSPSGLIEARVSAAVEILQRARRGRVVVLGAGTVYAARFAERWPTARVVDGDPVGWLQAAPRASVGVIVLAGVVDRLSAAELLRIMPLCAAALEPGGIVVADGPDPSLPQSLGEGGVPAPTLQRRIGVATIRVLAEAAGFAGVDSSAVAAGEWYVAWATVP
jgi:hypothetical protein